MRYLRPYWAGISIIIGLLLAQALAELFLPTLMSGIIDDGIIYGVENNVDTLGFIMRTGGLMIVIALLAGTCSITAAYISPRVAAGAARDLRKALFTKVENFSQAEFDKFSAASLITRCTNDITQVQQVANITARTLLYAPLLGIGGIIMATTRSVSMSWIVALAVIVLIGLVLTICLLAMPKFKVAQALMDKINKISRETLHGLMVIRSLGTQKHEQERFEETNKDIMDVGLFIARVMAVAGPAITLVMGGTQVLVIWVGAHNVAFSGLAIGDMMAFFQYSMQVIIAFMMISFVLVMVPRAQVSAARIVEVLDTDFSINDRPGAQAMEKTDGVVTFDNVRFRYPGAEADALEGISFTARPGETTAIIGATGSGKSTVAQLLLRFYDVSDGTVLLDGNDIRTLRQADLRAAIGYVPQKGQLISGTIESNIKYGHPEATEDEVKAVARVAQALGFIEEKDEKFAFEISQGGTNVSGGQRQRLSIARALARHPQILVFDDSFSALDFQTDAKLRRALKEHVANATVIVIAQRVGTIMNAEQILVLEKGQIVGRGTHSQLLENCAEYREIATSQGVAG
jgi:ATP-binding cassette subfamily B protein